MPSPHFCYCGSPNLTQIIDQNTTMADIIGPESWFLLQEFGINNEWLQSAMART